MWSNNLVTLSQGEREKNNGVWDWETAWLTGIFCFVGLVRFCYWQGVVDRIHHILFDAHVTAYYYRSSYSMVSYLRWSCKCCLKFFHFCCFSLKMSYLAINLSLFLISWLSQSSEVDVPIVRLCVWMECKFNIELESVLLYCWLGHALISWVQKEAYLPLSYLIKLML